MNNLVLAAPALMPAVKCRLRFAKRRQRHPLLLSLAANTATVLAN